MNIDKSRRNFLAGGLTLAALGVGAWTKPQDQGRNHGPYFQRLSCALNRAKIAKPTLVIDKALLMKNIQTLKGHIGHRFSYRAVAKSLPSIPLLKTVMEATDSQKLMLFHQPFINEVARKIPHADVLMGKPMPIKAAANFYREQRRRGFQVQGTGETFDPERQLQWLVDSPRRLRQYQQLAQQSGIKMRLNIELDVGFHRGGVVDDKELAQMLTLIEADPALTFSGFMGYDVHIANLPGDKIALRDKAMKIYSDKVEVARQITGPCVHNLTLNAAGSPTYQYYNHGDFPTNELATGSCLVKPTDFDVPSLTDHVPAAFIATPVIKALDKTALPGPEGFANLMAMWNPNRAKTFYTYGGFWKAKPESPKGLILNPVWGRSTNQEMLNGSNAINLQQDDWIF